MVLVFWNQTGNATFLRRAVPSLEREYSFWMAHAGEGPHSGSAVKLADGHVLNRYLAFTSLPRPESYVEDVETAKGRDPKAAAALYRNLASGAATGWDYSSRWFTCVAARERGGGWGGCVSLGACLRVHLRLCV